MVPLYDALPLIHRNMFDRFTAMGTTGGWFPSSARGSHAAVVGCERCSENLNLGVIGSEANPAWLRARDRALGDLIREGVTAQVKHIQTAFSFQNCTARQWAHLIKMPELDPRFTIDAIMNRVALSHDVWERQVLRVVEEVDVAFVDVTVSVNAQTRRAPKRDGVELHRVVEPARAQDMLFYRGDVFSSNASMLYVGGTLHVCVKQHNQRFPLGAKGAGVYWLALWRFDANLQLQTATTFAVDPTDCSFDARGRQDPRLFLQGGEVWVLKSVQAPDHTFNMRASRLIANGGGCETQTGNSETLVSEPGVSNKNWCPIYGTDMFVFDVHPTLTIGTIMPRAVLHRHASSFAIAPPDVVHGGTNYAHFPELASYVGIVQVKNTETWRYTQVWVALDEATFEMRGRGEPFRVETLLGWDEYSDVVFCMGIERCCGRLLVTFSQHDERMVLFSVADPVAYLSAEFRHMVGVKARPPKAPTPKIVAHACSMVRRT